MQRSAFVWALVLGLLMVLGCTTVTSTKEQAQNDPGSPGGDTCGAACSPVGTWSETTANGATATVVYAAGGTATWTGGGSGTWTLSGNTVVADGSGSGGSWTDTLTVSSDGNTMTGSNSGGISITETREQ